MRQRARPAPPRSPPLCAHEIGVSLPNKQCQHRTLHVQKDVPGVQGLGGRDEGSPSLCAAPGLRDVFAHVLDEYQQLIVMNANSG